MCVYVCICMYMYLYMYMYVSVCICMCICMYMYAYVCIRICVYMCRTRGVSELKMRPHVTSPLSAQHGDTTPLPDMAHPYQIFARFVYIRC